MFVAGPAMPVTEEAIDALDPVRLLRAPHVCADRLVGIDVTEQDLPERLVECDQEFSVCESFQNLMLRKMTLRLASTDSSLPSRTKNASARRSRISSSNAARQAARMPDSWSM